MSDENTSQAFADRLQVGIMTTALLFSAVALIGVTVALSGGTVIAPAIATWLTGHATAIGVVAAATGAAAVLGGYVGAVATSLGTFFRGGNERQNSQEQVVSRMRQVETPAVASPAKEQTIEMKAKLENGEMVYKPVKMPDSEITNPYYQEGLGEKILARQTSTANTERRL